MHEPMPNMSKTRETSTNFATRISRKVEDPYLIARVAEFKRTVASDNWPRCSVHQMEVVIHEEGAAAPWGVPGFVVYFTGCCDSGLDRFFHFMNVSLGLSRPA
jgi:hypothetical protein